MSSMASCDGALDFGLLVERFQFPGQFVDAQIHGCGHIHDTYVASFREPDVGLRRYLLQRINEHVFRDVNGLMANIVGVTEHLQEKIRRQGGDPSREALALIPTVEGQSHWRSEELGCWRAYQFIEGAQTHDQVLDRTQLLEVAQAFGTFQCLLADYPAAQLHETIPDFHHTPRRYRAFQQAVEADVVQRAKTAQAEIAFARRRAERMATLLRLHQDGHLPLRVTHNDTKVNNVMIDDETGKAVCVIDLDTVMPGLAAYDFGDLVRSGACLTAEDCPDVSESRFDLDAYEIIVRGYLSSAGDFLNDAELAHLHLAAPLITLELGMRFLADYLQGDVYFKTQRPAQNLDRCRTQFRMVEEMEARGAEMADVVTQFGGRET